MPRFYNIAHGEKILETSGNFPWPYDIGLCFESVKHPVSFGEGVAHGSGWCAVTPSEALEDKWRKYFDITDSHWLLPFIEDLLNGIPLPKSKIIEVAEARAGSALSTYNTTTT